jgi:two-component system NtrC family sensor kinase
VPLQHKDQVIGVIEAVNRPDRPFDEHDLALLWTLAGSAASAIANARLYEETALHLAETHVLQEVMQDAAATLDFDQVLARALQTVHRALGIEFLCCMLPDEAGAGLVVHPSAIGLLSLPAAGLRIPLAGSVTGQVYTTGQPALVVDTTNIPHFFALPGRIEIRSELAVPVRVGDRVIAVLDAGRPHRAAFHENDLRLFEAIATQLSIVLENARLYQAEREQRRLVEQSQAQLVQTEKMAALGRLIASIAHEINNPLQSIQGCLTLATEELAAGQDRAEMESYLSLAGREIDRIAAIVLRMRDFYRPAHEGLQPTDLHAVVDSVLQLSGKKLQHSRVRVERDLAADLPLIQANPDHIKQVFLNLVLNALDAMPQGGTIRVRTARGQMQSRDDAPPRPAVRVEFSDTGSGMSPEVASRIFEPFYTTKEGGTGLGLSVSYGIITAHHGEITVTSQEGVGATFTMLLPVEQPGREA